MTLVSEGSVCAICGETLNIDNGITGLPASSSIDHPLDKYFDQGLHTKCFNNWDKKDEVLNIIDRERKKERNLNHPNIIW